MLEEEKTRKDQGISTRDRERAAALHQSSASRRQSVSEVSSRWPATAVNPFGGSLTDREGRQHSSAGMMI